jgi:hypothetical protein
MPLATTLLRKAEEEMVIFGGKSHWVLSGKICGFEMDSSGSKSVAGGQ